MSALDLKPQIWKLAVDLGLGSSNRPVQKILDFVKKRVRAAARKYGCKSLEDLLLAVAADVKTVFEEVHSDAELEGIKLKYVSQGEHGFATLDKELRRQDYAVTIRRTNPKAWDSLFVSVIDCRGDKLYKVYFSKWHEVAHLLTLTEQRRLVFRRTHVESGGVADPEEKLMDIIASDLGFLPDFLRSGRKTEISFNAIDRIRAEFCSSSSRQAAMIGIVKAMATPCILLEARLACKKDQNGERRSEAALRAVHVTVNEAARQENMLMFKNWRVPAHSIISKVLAEHGHAAAIEDLDWWETSGGGRLNSRQVHVEAKYVPGAVLALVVPVLETQ